MGFTGFRGVGMNRNKKISLLAIADGVAGVECDVAIILSRERDIGAQRAAQNAGQVFGDGEREILFFDAVRACGAVVVSPVTGINDDC